MLLLLLLFIIFIKKISSQYELFGLKNVWLIFNFFLFFYLSSLIHWLYNFHLHKCTNLETVIYHGLFCHSRSIGQLFSLYSCSSTVRCFLAELAWVSSFCYPPRLVCGRQGLTVVECLKCGCLACNKINIIKSNRTLNIIIINATTLKLSSR